MTARLSLFVIAALALLYACESDLPKGKEISPLSAEVSWSLDSISLSAGQSYTSWTITNNGPTPWSPGWSLHYNQIAGAPTSTSNTDIEAISISGEYLKHQYTGTDTIQPGESVSYSMVQSGIVKRMSETPRGLFLVHGTDVIDIDQVYKEGVNHETLAALGPITPSDRYEINSKIKTSSEVLPIIPAPVALTLQDGSFSVDETFSISFGDGLSDEESWLMQEIKKYYSGSITSTGNTDLSITIDSNINGAEAYELTVSEDGIEIIASDPAGAFYGLQSFIQLIDPTQLNAPRASIDIPYVEIKDAPRFPYRGFMLDVARNYHRKEKVLEVLDWMSMYKLNKFHFHLMDDEGWRLEIPDLPELTEIGSVRGYTPDESDRLRPAYGSGGVAEDSYSTGYYSVSDYQEILQYAADRHIEVIPEIDLPGHARAAIISMRARYHRLMNEGDEAAAKEYLLHDPADTSVYRSAQNYNDNVINLCQSGAYNFIEKVLEEVIKMHKEAGVPLQILHTGGDEVPYGAWQGSPMCQTFISDMENLTGTEDLHPNMLYFIRSILNKHGVTTAGWEEIVLEHGEDAHNGTAINEDLVGQPMLPYVWNAVWGWGREDMLYKLANTGFDVILCNSSQFYFDLAYDSDPRENGLSWSGLVNTKSAFDLEPFDIFRGVTTDIGGNALPPDYVQSKEALQPSAQERILGVQAQLWSETIIEADLVDYMLLPKLFGIAERAWSPSLSASEYDDRYGAFVHTIGQRELIRLDRYREGGAHYRIPPPGLSLQDGRVSMNTTYPGLDIRYTIDGTAPDGDSPLYTAPFEIDSGQRVTAAAFNSLGRSSNTSSIE